MGLFKAIGKAVGGVANAVGDVWSGVRDPLESLAVLAGNYYLPGSSLLTSRLASKESQGQLGSPVGVLAQLGTGASGAYAGNLGNYGALGDWITGEGAVTGSRFGLGSAKAGLGLNPATSGLGLKASAGALGTGMSGMGTFAPAAAATDWFDFTKWRKSLVNPATLFGIGSGLYNIGQAGKLADLAQQQALRATPWDTSGGRSLADMQLQALLRDPGQAAQNDPSYQLRLQAAQRGASMQGSGSGAMAVQAANASTSWLNDRIAQLSGLAGAGINPAYGGQLAISGTNSANTLRNQGISDIAGAIYPRQNQADLMAELLRYRGV